MIELLILAGWLLIGAAVGYVEARRGHWHRGWVPYAVFGPFAIPLALQARRRESSGAQVVIRSGARDGEGLHVLVGIDGSPASEAAAGTVVDLLGSRLGRLTLAAVLDYDSAMPPYDELPMSGAPGGDQASASEILRTFADRLEAQRQIQPGAVVLSGDPATALLAYAVENDCDLLVGGTRGHGMSERLFGSCASKLADHQEEIAILLVPPGAESA